MITRAWIELTAAVLALLGAGACWLDSQHTVPVAPVAEGQPVTTSLVYDPALLLLTMLLLATGGMLAVAGIGHTVVMTTSRSKRSRGRC
ncbi:MAG: hypothetical protein WCI78_08270 [Mycobacterium sp.]